MTFGERRLESSSHDAPPYEDVKDMLADFDAGRQEGGTEKSAARQPKPFEAGAGARKPRPPTCFPSPPVLRSRFLSPNIQNWARVLN